jgi:predicted enzyme related to lactoylglutathione lyase
MFEEREQGDANMQTRLDRASQPLRQCVLAAAFLGVTCATTATAAPFEVPALVQPASLEHHVGKVIWVDLVTPDLDRAKLFYAGLFGWTFRDVHTGETDYSVALLDGRPVGGLIHRPAPLGKPRQPAWLTFIAVADVDRAKRIALEHGGKVLFEPHNYPQRGRQAVFADPQGAVFAVLASSSGDPPDLLAAPGDWIWSSLIARDAGADAAFYQTLFGYEVFGLPSASDDGLEHLMLSTDGYARASANRLPADAPNRHPHWLNFVRVIDTVKMATKVVTLGGRVLVEPRIDRQGSWVALVADPAGAPFGLLEWPDSDIKEVAR